MANTQRKSQEVYSDDFYHGLPVLADKGLKALVVGASGMSGQSMIDVLLQSPQRWNQIYALSRRAPTASQSTSLMHVPVDLLEDPQETASKLSKHNVEQV